MSRHVHARYEDPLDLIWLACAREVGFAVVRSSDAYASFDGAHTITLSTREHFDADDSLAQLIFHELCHALVAGPRGMARVDWGMENIDERDLRQEHACHRLQAALADRYGLRGLFAVTTEHRTYWDALPVDPLGPSADPALPLAREAFERATEGAWAAALGRALAATAALATIMRTLDLPADSLWRETRPLHASGFPLGSDDQLRCRGCAWSHGEGARGGCRQARGHGKGRIELAMQACVRFEPKLDADACERCGACCREGFDRVELSARELVRKRHPTLVAVDGFGAHLPRPGGLCVGLQVSAEQRSHRCRIYEERPRACRDFAIGGDACLDARRRVGLSP